MGGRDERKNHGHNDENLLDHRFLLPKYPERRKTFAVWIFRLTLAFVQPGRDEILPAEKLFTNAGNRQFSQTAFE